jgi:hypothetical protein
MPLVPAFCDTCGTAFSSGWNIENSTHIGFSNCQAGPCPACGGMGRIPDGIFNFIGSTIEILSAPDRTVAERRLLARILGAARTNEETRDQVIACVENEVPSFANLVKLLPENKPELYGFLAVVLAALQLFTQTPQPPSINITNVVQQVIVEPQRTQPANISKAAKKLGRNAPCLCGSGIKYKKCCGANK